MSKQCKPRRLWRLSIASYGNSHKRIKPRKLLLARLTL